MLTDRQVRLEKHDPARDRYISDGDNLYLKIAMSGAKFWVFRYKYGAARKTMTLGTYPELTLGEAREARQAQSKILASGKDPLGQKHLARDDLREALTVEELGQRFMNEWLSQFHLSGYQQPIEAYRTLRRDPIRVLGKMLARDVTPEILQRRVFKPMEQRGNRVAPKRTLALTKKMFWWGAKEHLIPSNPADPIMPKDVGGKERSVHTNLLLEQIKEAVDVLNSPDTGIHVQTRLGVKFMLATSKRAHEISTLEWDHLELEIGEWLNPAHLTKEQHADHKVFLSRYALRILEQLKRLNPKSRYVFPRIGGTGGRPAKHPHITHSTLSNAVLTLFKDGRLTKKWTPHDLRRTFSSRVADMGVHPHVSEKCLDHLMTGTMAVYNRASYFPERRACMDLWGETLEQLDPMPDLVDQAQSMGVAHRGVGAFEERRQRALQMRAEKRPWSEIAEALKFPSDAAVRMACNRDKSPATDL